MLIAKGSKYDWPTIFIYIMLVAAGWVNIYSASFNETSLSFFDVKQVYTKQLMFICLSALLIVFILAIESKFYERFSSVIYLVEENNNDQLHKIDNPSLNFSCF